MLTRTLSFATLVSEVNFSNMNCYRIEKKLPKQYLRIMYHEWYPLPMGLHYLKITGEKKEVPLDPSQFNPTPNTKKPWMLLKQVCSSKICEE